jgi:hypothetical protein
MHLLEKYALSTGSKIKKPFIIKKYFPLPFEKYITIQNSSGMTGKCYDYFQDVIDFILPKLEKNGYKIVQIGSKEDAPLNNVINLQGMTNINQTAFILDNSKLHIGNDSFAIHMCSAFGIPLIALYSISSPEIAGPFWKNNNQICLTPENWAPSFNPNEIPKRVNEIKIEKIINSINKLLFKEDSESIDTLSIGHEYKQNIIVEIFPNHIIPSEIFPNQILNIRFDYQKELNEQDYTATLNNISTRACTIITDKPFNLQPFFQLKDKIKHIFYDVTKNINLEFINQMSVLGFNFTLIFYLSNNNEILNIRKFECIDYPFNINIVEEPTKFNIEINSNTFYKSKKIILFNNQTYLSKAAQESNKPINLNNGLLIQNLNEIADLDIFVKKDLNYSLVYKNLV